MVRKIGILFSAVALGALVTSCGDDDNDMPPLPPVTETSAPTPAPTPTPTAPLDFSLTEDFAATSFNINAISAFFTADGQTDEVFSNASRVNGGAGIEFTASPDMTMFFFPDFTESVTFGADDFASVNDTERRYSRANEALTLFLPFDDILRVTYEIDDQAFSLDATPGTLRSERIAVFANPVTTDAELDTDLAYAGSVEVAGGQPGVTASNATSAPDITFSIDADDADGDDAVSATIQIFETVNGTSQVVATLVFEKIVTTNNMMTTTTGVVTAGNAFAGSLTDTDNNLAGNFLGLLAGPNREEIAVTFSVTSTEEGNTTRYVGSFIGQLQ